MYFETVTVSDELIILPEISAATWVRDALAHALVIDPSTLADFYNVSSKYIVSHICIMQLHVFKK